MDFENLLNDDMLVAMKNEVDQTQKLEMTAEELENLIRKVVKEEVNKAMNETAERLENCIVKTLKKENKKNEIVSIHEHIKKIDRQSIDVQRLARSYGSMQCGGWVFYVNEQEGKHLWKIKDDGSENQELYSKTISSVKKVEDGYVFFDDAQFNNCKMPINGGQVSIESRF